MIDVDRFKSVNDSSATGSGTMVLRLMARELALHTRREEFVARIGGEEFVVVLPVTDRDELARPARGSGRRSLRSRSPRRPVRCR